MKALDEVISAFRRFPGVGPKQAERFALYIVKASSSEVEALIEAMRKVKTSVGYCKECFNYSDGDLCTICSDGARDHSLICVVERFQDLAAIEKSKTFNGVYHVLHGAISPAEGITPDMIKFRELIDRVKKAGTGVKEIIIATNPDSDGEATALYIQRALRPFVPKISRIACGIPLGGDIDYMDEVTLGCALKGRIKL